MHDLARNGATCLEALTQLLLQFVALPCASSQYVVCTRLDFDRAGGGAQDNSSAEIVAAKGFDERLTRNRDVLPPRLAELDRDHNVTLDRDELAGVDPFRTTTNVRAGLGLNIALSQRAY